MTKKSYKRISIDKFMKIWKLAQIGDDPRKILPNLTELIKEEWKSELILMFNEAKARMSYGPISDSELRRYAQLLTEPPKTEPYDRSYRKRYPDTYKKTGELYRKMRGNEPYEEIGKGRKLGLRIRIPLKTDGVPPASPNTYRILEENRSYVKAAFLRAWPNIVEKIIEDIGK